MFIGFVSGNLVRDPEVGTTASGNLSCKFTVATDSWKSMRNGQKITEYINVGVYGKKAENPSRYLRKGHKVTVVGNAATYSYQGRDGKMHMGIELAADVVEFMFNKDDPIPESEIKGEPQRLADDPGTGVPDGFVPVESDELPF